MIIIDLWVSWFNSMNSKIIEIIELYKRNIDLFE